MLNISDIRQTLDMIDKQHLDIRTITMGISLRDCAHPDMAACAQKVYDKICRSAEHLVETGCAIEREFGIPIVNKRISVTPIAMVAALRETSVIFGMLLAVLFLGERFTLTKLAAVVMVAASTMLMKMQ